jgi:inner membrane protein COX18
MNSVRSRVLRAPHRALPLAARSQLRHFHPTKPAPWINEALDASAGLIHGVHNITGLPWVASIPLTALLVRTLVGLPLQMYTRVHARRGRDILPLKQAWANWADSRKKQLGGGPLSKQPRMEIDREYHDKIKFVHKRWGISATARFAPVLQLPVWIMLMESIRGMSGNKNGLVPWLLSLIEGDQEATDAAVNSLHLIVEPTFANEGALWFPDLLAGDSTGILPAVLAASILLNVQAGWKATSRAELADMPKMEMYRAASFNGIRLLIQILALNVGVSAYLYEMPVALLIYWISSSSIATLQTYILEKKMFMKPPIPVSSRRYVDYDNPEASDPFHMKLR